jgi:hypothetical protein
VRHTNSTADSMCKILRLQQPMGPPVHAVKRDALARKARPARLCRQNGSLSCADKGLCGYAHNRMLGCANRRAVISCAHQKALLLGRQRRASELCSLSCADKQSAGSLRQERSFSSLCRQNGSKVVQTKGLFQSVQTKDSLVVQGEKPPAPLVQTKRLQSCRQKGS